MNDDDLDDFNPPVVDDLPLADTPTAWMPGTKTKIEVMRERAEAGRSVFHPGDARMDQERLVRVPMQEGYPAKFEWEQMEEKEYRALGRTETWWDRRRQQDPWDEDEDTPA